MLQHSKGDGYCRLPPRTTAPTTASVAISNSGQQQQQSLSLPLSPETTLAHFRHLLTDYEASEILAFPSVFFAGASGVEKIGPKARPTGATGAERLNVPGSNASDSSGSAPNGTLAEKFNHGYDDSRGDYYLTKHDHIGYRYEILSFLGKGSFGQVAKCYDHEKRVHVAVKLIRNKKRFEKQGIVEVKILRHLRDMDPEDSHSMIHIQDSFYFRGHLCITFELLGVNLYEWIKAGGFRGVHLGIVREIARQLLSCLVLLAKANIIHCDLKPENILLRLPHNTKPTKAESNSFHSTEPSSKSSSKTARSIPLDFDPHSMRYAIKVIDFGSSCFETERVYTYVQSRFYRSPEVILGIPYAVSIDIWSLGCILVELFTGYPIFPGENENEQLACIMELFGIPSVELVGRGSRRRHFFDSNGMPKISPNSKGKRKRPNTKSLTATVNTQDAGFLDFIRRSLEWDPLKRMTAAEGLRHPWLMGSSNSLPRNVASLPLSVRGGLVGGGEPPLVASSYKDGHRHISTSYTTSSTNHNAILPLVKKHFLTRQSESLSSSLGLKPPPLSSSSSSQTLVGAKSYTSSGINNATLGSQRFRPPIMDPLRGFELSQTRRHGLPPLTVSNPVLAKSKYPSDRSSLHLSKPKSTSVETIRDYPVRSSFSA